MKAQGAKRLITVEKQENRFCGPLHTKRDVAPKIL
jgi:hypothetical protein